MSNDKLGGAERVAENTSPEETQEIVTSRMRERGQSTVSKKAVQLQELRVEYVPITSIGPNQYNPNRQNESDFELLCKSIREDGFTQPVIVHRQSMKIVDGEHRWRAACKLGYSEIPIVLVDMTEEQMKIATLRHNRARGSEDIELSQQVLRDLQSLGAMDWAQDSLGITDDELNSLLETTTAAEALAGDDFTEAWVPDFSARDSDAIDSGIGTRGRVSERPTGGEQMIALTAGAAVAIKQQEQKIKNAPTEQARQEAARDGGVFRVSALYADAEAVLVRRVLGNEPAVRMVDLCRKWVARQSPAPS